jgi:hypothetical protein
MNTTEIITFLREFNRWRRGDDSIPQPQPDAAGEAIDAACAGLIRMECENEELRAEAAPLRAQADILQANVEKARKRAGALYKCWIEAESERDEARQMAEELLEKNAKQAVEIVRLKEAAQ